jgi:hypothetical protein
MQIFNIHTNTQQKLWKELTPDKWWPYIECMLSFLKNDKVQQPVIISNTMNKRPRGLIGHLHECDMQQEMR